MRAQELRYEQCDTFFVTAHRCLRLSSYLIVFSVEHVGDVLGHLLLLLLQLSTQECIKEFSMRRHDHFAGVASLLSFKIWAGASCASCTGSGGSSMNQSHVAVFGLSLWKPAQTCSG